MRSGWPHWPIPSTSRSPGCKRPMRAGSPDRSARQRRVDDGLRLTQEGPQMVLAAETLGVDLVDIFGTGWARGKPSTVRHDLDPADRRTVAGGFREHAFNRLPAPFGDPSLLRR